MIFSDAKVRRRCLIEFLCFPLFYFPSHLVTRLPSFLSLPIISLSFSTSSYFSILKAKMNMYCYWFPMMITACDSFFTKLDLS